jgi:hypothetical protein
VKLGVLNYIARINDPGGKIPLSVFPHKCKKFSDAEREKKGEKSFSADESH